MRAKKIFQEALKNGGATLSSNFKSVDFSQGFQVSLKDYEKVLLIDYKVFKKVLRDYKRLSKRFKNCFIGLWVDDNKIYFDISRHYNFKKQALLIGESNEQKAIFDWSTKESIYL